MPTTEECGKAAYDAYCEAFDWNRGDGNHLPFWCNLREDTRAGWRMAAEAANGRFRERIERLAADWNNRAGAVVPFDDATPDARDIALAARIARAFAEELLGDDEPGGTLIPAELAEGFTPRASEAGLTTDTFIRNLLSEALRNP